MYVGSIIRISQPKNTDVSNTLSISYEIIMVVDKLMDEYIDSVFCESS